MKNKVFLSLGSNLGDKKKNLTTTLNEIDTKIGKIIKSSSIYKTKAWGKNDQDDFLNLVVELETDLNVFLLLEKCLEIEENLGRKRIQKWGERIIDIDILFYSNEIIYSENLKIPHPLLHLRKFVLVPLVKLNEKLIHPILKKTSLELLHQCDDQLEVEEI